MRKNLFILFSLLLIFSCSKESRVNKKLDGNWQVEFVKIGDGEGFSYNDSVPVGSWFFNSEGNLVSSEVAYKYTNLNGYTIKDTFKLIEESYVFNDQADRIFINSLADTINARIILLTKKSMEIEYYDLNKYRLVRFILSKD